MNSPKHNALAKLRGTATKEDITIPSIVQIRLIKKSYLETGGINLCNQN